MSAVETLVNVVFRLEPRFETKAIMAHAIPAGMRPYPVVVAPVSLHKKCFDEWSHSTGSLFLEYRAMEVVVA